MKGFIQSYRKRTRAEEKRHRRLMRKIQKAKALARVDEILSLPSWGKRFGRAARLRATG